jgi:hypothetical protein
MKQSEEKADKQREACTVQIETTDGKIVNLCLLDAYTIEMLNGKTYIHGKSYDIFADPMRK